MPKAAKSKDTDRVEIKVYAAPAEKALFQRAADADGRALSNWVVEVCKRAAKAQLGEGKGRG